MSRKARALPSSTLDETSVRSAPAQAWAELFGRPAPRLDALVAQVVAWEQQRLVHGDVPPLIARDLALISAEAEALRTRDAQQLMDKSSSRTHAARPIVAAEGHASATSRPTTTAPVSPVRKGASRTTTPTLRVGAAPLPPASSQLLVGTRLVKTHGGQTHVVEVTPNGMLYDGELFSSLSAVAKRITGTHWNGLLFFGLRQRKTYPAKVASHG